MFWIATILIIVLIGVLPGIAGQEAAEAARLIEQEYATQGSVDSQLLRNIENRLSGDSRFRADVFSELPNESGVRVFALNLDYAGQQTRADVAIETRRDNQFSPDIAREIRFQKQCFLSYNLLEVLEKVRQIPGRGLITEPQYHTVILSNGTAAPADITSLIVSRPDIHQLLNAKPFLLSYFMPQVRLYKVFGNPRGDDDREEIEFVFNDHVTKSRIEDIFENKRGRGDGVGLMSFNWEFLGVNPAEVENNIKATLTLYFNNMRDFEEQRGREGLRYRFSDLIIAEPLYSINANNKNFPEVQRAFNPNFFRLKVVAGWTVPRASDAARELFEENGVDFDDLVELVEQNKKVLYLNLISHDLNFNDDGSMELSVEYQALIEGVFTSPQSDILNVQPSELTNTATGQLEEIRSDLRAVRGYRTRRCGGDDAPEVVELPGGGVVPVTPGDFQNDQPGDELIERIQSTEREMAQALNLLERQDRATAYEGILNALQASDRIYTATITSQSLGFASLDALTEEDVRVVDLTEDVQERFIEAYTTIHGEGAEIPETVEIGFIRNLVGEIGSLGEFDRDREESQITEAAVMRRMIATSRLFAGGDEFEVETNFNIGTSGARDRDFECKLNVPITQDLLRPLQNIEIDLESITSGEGIDEEFSAEQYREAAERIQRFIDAGPGDENIPLQFMFFGDILDVVMRNANIWLKESNVAVYLGSFAYNDPREYEEGADPSTVFLPLSYIPISVELFSMWFFEEIIEKQRTVMSIRQFIRSVLDKLIINAFGSECVFDPGGRFVLTQENFSVQPEFYTIPKNKLEDANMYYSSGGGLPGGVASYSRMERAIRGEGIRLLDYDPSAQYSDYAHVVLYQARSDDGGAGDIYDTDIASAEGGYVGVAQRDIARGVYHLNIGSDRGLVKSINFERIDQDYLLEARISAAGELGSFGQLRQRYNATVTLYGNMFFYPGQYIFINPSMVGAGDGSSQTTVPTIEALTTKIGIGGYFLITRVENIIESGLFETILKCSWVYSGFKIEGGSSDGCSPVRTLNFDYEPSLGESSEGVRQAVAQGIQILNEENAEEEEEQRQIERDRRIITAGRPGSASPFSISEEQDARRREEARRRERLREIFGDP